MPAAPTANLSFLPWVRQGAASAIATVDTLGPNQAAVADVSITLNVNNAPLPAVPVRLRGPADVVGIDGHQVVRTDPRPGTSDFEPNCFPSIEFDRADFPWLFTPARANTNSQLRPWLCLVVVRKQDGVQLASTVDSPLPSLRIAAPAKPFIELPDLKDCWAWAHAQVAADNSTDPNAVSTALNGAPQLSLSRLVCPRLLAANTDYIACVVPTFELGRKAGLGLPIADTELTAATALAPAWTLRATAPLQVQLPVFYSWEFRTGPAGDFASLAQRLQIAIPQGLGQRTVDIGHPGFDVPGGLPSSATVQVEGALLPLTGSTSPVLWSDAVAASFEKGLADVVNQPGLNQVIAPTADPLLVPPLYGRWHAARAIVTPGAANWFDELNLDPRWRSAAAIGTRVIQEHQEALMASAWEQAAEIQPVNQRMRQLQLSMVVGESLHARHLSALTEEMSLRIASPVFSRIRVPSPDPLGRTLTAAMMVSSLPVPATQAAMRRLGRQRGPLTRRIAVQGYGRSPDKTWVARLNIGDGLPPAARPAIDRANLPPLPTVDSVVTAIWNSGFQIAAEGQPVPPLPAVDPLPPEWDYPGSFRAAAADHLSRIRPRLIAAFKTHVTMSETVSVVRAQMHPRVALANLARAAVSKGDNVLQPTAPGVTPVGTETVMMAPSFPQPMYEPLKEKSQDLLLPGLDTVLPDTVVGLRTNRAFVEAYMIGLNVEMARELLWRGFPTDQQGTYFTHFWGNDGGAAAASDIDDLRKNLGRALGTAPPNAPANQFVLLLKSSLLRRYPSALIYLTPALTGTSGTPAPDIFPIFNGAMEPDVNFVGFPLTPAAAIGSGSHPGYFVVIQEHPTEPRFGLDAAASTALANKSHLVIGTQPPAGVPLKGRTWGKNSAHMAEITRRLPVRITIHASQLVALH
jgi:hypothetical protein